MSYWLLYYFKIALIILLFVLIGGFIVLIYGKDKKNPNYYYKGKGAVISSLIWIVVHIIVYVVFKM